MSSPDNMNLAESVGHDNPNELQFDLGDFANVDNFQDQDFDRLFNGTNLGTGLIQEDFDQLKEQDAQQTDRTSAAQYQSMNMMQGFRESDADMSFGADNVPTARNAAQGAAQDFQLNGDFNTQMEPLSGMYQMSMDMPREVQLPLYHAPAPPSNIMATINSLFDPRIGWYYPALHHPNIGPYMPAPGAQSEYYSTMARAIQTIQPIAPVVPVEGQATGVKQPRIHRKSIVQDCTCGGYQEKVPRPCNLFILYRNDKQKKILARNPRLGQQGASRQAAAAWKEESPAVKEHYRKLADEAKRKHELAYPNYKYEPGKAIAARFGTPNCTCGAYQANMQARQARAGADNGTDMIAPPCTTPANQQVSHGNVEGELDVDSESESLLVSDEEEPRPIKRTRKSQDAAAPSQPASLSDSPVLDNNISDDIPEHQRADATAAPSKKRKRTAGNDRAEISTGPHTPSTRSGRRSPDMVIEKQYLFKNKWWSSVAPQRPTWAEAEREIQVPDKRL